MPELVPVDIDFLNTAERVVTVERTVPFDAATIWPYLADNNAWLSWFAKLKSIESNPAVWSAAGQTRTIVVEPFLKVDEVSVELTENKRWAMSVIGSNLPMAAKLLEVVDLIDAGEGRTTLKWSGALDPIRFTGPFAKVLTKQLTSAWTTSFEQLEQHLQAEAA